jgi:hypothetical protein
MILIFFQNKQIHQFFNGFGAVTTVNGSLHIDGNDTTTCAADVQWKYIADQVLERNESGEYIHDADYYETSIPTPSTASQIDDCYDGILALADMIGTLMG